jgi:cytosine/adenosine deaminase-related metal-dependent hydrolase
VAIRNATLLTMNSGLEVLHGDILVRGSRIVALGRVDGQADEEIDATGLVAMPGFVQTHVHLCQTLFRNQADDLSLLDWLRQRIWPLEGAHDEETLRISAELGVAELIKGGSTTVLDMATVRHTEVVFEVARRTGLRATIGKCLMDDAETTPPELLEPAQKAIDESLSLFEKWHNQEDGRLRYAFAPRFAVSCTDGLLREVAQLSADREILVHTHAAESRDEVRLVQQRTGVTNLLYLDRVKLLNDRLCVAHCIWLDGNETTLLARSGAAVLHCPSSNLKLGSGIARVPEMRQQGILVTLGADGAACNNNLDMFREMRLAALVQKPRLGPQVMPAREVVEMATILGARALRLDDEIGSLEVGKRADIILLDLNSVHTMPEGDLYAQIVYAANTSDVRTVLIDGQIVMRDRVLLTLEEEKVRREAEAALKVLLERIS